MSCSLKRLLNRLPLDQLRALVASIDNVEPRFDIIGNLPMDLCFQIFSHLEPLDLLRVLQVCRPWAQFFGSSILGRKLRGQWKRRGDGMVPSPKGQSTRELVTVKAQHDLAFRTGHASSMVLHPWNVPSSFGLKGRGPPNACYRQGYLAWIDPKGCLVHYMHLQSGSRNCLGTGQMWSFGHLAMSESIIVAINKGTNSDECVVWRYHKNAPGGRFPIRASTQSVTASGNTLALFHAERLTTDDWLLSVTTYMVGDLQVAYFPIMLTSFGVLRDKRWKLLVGPDGDSIIFCYISRGNEEHGDPEQIICTCFDLKGQIQASGTLDIRNTEFTSHQEFIEDSSTTIDGNIVIMVNVCSRSLSEISYIAYNQVLKKLEMHGHSHSGSIQCAGPRDLFLCQDVVYWCAGREQTVLVTLDIRKRAYIVKPIENYPYLYPESPFEVAPCWLQGDEVFLVRIAFHCVVIWCFSKTMNMYSQYSRDPAWARGVQAGFLGIPQERDWNTSRR